MCVHACVRVGRGGGGREDEAPGDQEWGLLFWPDAWRAPAGGGWCSAACRPGVSTHASSAVQPHSTPAAARDGQPQPNIAQCAASAAAAATARIRLPRTGKPPCRSVPPYHVCRAHACTAPAGTRAGCKPGSRRQALGGRRPAAQPVGRKTGAEEPAPLQVAGAAGVAARQGPGHGGAAGATPAPGGPAVLPAHAYCTLTHSTPARPLPGASKTAASCLTSLT